MTNANVPSSFSPQPIATADLLLRPIVASDLEALFALYSDPEVMRGWGTPAHQSRGDTQKLIDLVADQMQKGELIRWAITEKHDPSVLCGDVGFWRFVRVRRRGELGAKLARRFWQKGWMTQALSAVIHYGFAELGLHSVEGNIDPKNLGSLRLVEKIGFLKVGLIPELSFDPFESRYLDMFLYSLAKTNWKGFECEVLPPRP